MYKITVNTLVIIFCRFLKCQSLHVVVNKCRPINYSSAYIYIK